MNVSTDSMNELNEQFTLLKLSLNNFPLWVALLQSHLSPL